MEEQLSPSEQKYIQLANEHWKKYRPKMYQELKKSGQLEQALLDAAKLTSEAELKIMDGLKSQHPEPEEFLERVKYETWIQETAWQMVREQWILLPSEEDVPNLGEEPANQQETTIA